MIVKDLITELAKMPPDADVAAVSDGAARNEINTVWLSRSGLCILANEDENVYWTDDRPKCAPASSDSRYWKYKDGESENI